MSDWIEWNGGECPVDKICKVDVKLRDGYTITEAQANELRWYQRGFISDIIAYRLAEPASVPPVPPAPDMPDLVNAPPHYNTDEALDEFADLMELWLQRRARGETPYHIKTAIMAVIKEIAGQ